MRSAALTVTDNTPCLRKIHCAAPSTTPTNSGEPGGAAHRKWALTIGEKASGTISDGHQPCGDSRRHGEDHTIIAADLDCVRFEHQPGDVIRAEVQRPQPARQSGSRRRGRARQQAPDRRNVSESPSRGTSGRHAAPPRPSVSTRIRQNSRADARSTRGVQRSDGKRLPQPAEKPAAAIQHLGDRRRRAGPAQRQRSEVVSRTGVRDPSGALENPPRHGPSVRPHTPALPGLRVDERKDGILRPLQRVACADPFEIVERPAVSGQQQMVAVVDAAAELVIEIGTAAAAGMRRLLRKAAPGTLLPPMSTAAARPARPAPTICTGQSPLIQDRGATPARASAVSAGSAARPGRATPRATAAARSPGRRPPSPPQGASPGDEHCAIARALSRKCASAIAASSRQAAGNAGWRSTAIGSALQIPWRSRISRGK